MKKILTMVRYFDQVKKNLAILESMFLNCLEMKSIEMLESLKFFNKIIPPFLP